MDFFTSAKEAKQPVVANPLADTGFDQGEDDLPGQGELEMVDFPATIDGCNDCDTLGSKSIETFVPGLSMQLSQSIVDDESNVWNQMSTSSPMDPY